MEVELENKSVKNNVDLIFLDDSIALTQVWELRCEQAGKKIVTFNAPKPFLEGIENHDKTTPIYIDVSLGEKTSGITIAKEIFDKGHKNIYLATGFNPDMYRMFSWIKGVVGKEPPY